MPFSDFTDAIGDAATSVDDKLSAFISKNKNKSNDFNSDGFIVPGLSNSNDNNLPSSGENYNRRAGIKRNLIHWFIPQFGVVKMYVNPNSIVYKDSKIIKTDQTKGGYSIQYWGEELTELTIHGTTGSSSIEGINVLQEIYRAEQLAFDSVALALAADNYNYGLAQNAMQMLTAPLASALPKGSGASINSLLFAGSQMSVLAPKNMPSLASLAAGIEMYYNGWVFRGFFKTITVTEKADNFLMDYSMTFVVTQRRGYRHNTFDFARSAVAGPSNNSMTDGVPLSYAGINRK
jgi:hypothetical protein